MIASKEAGRALSAALVANSVLRELDVSSNVYNPNGRNGDGPGFAQELAVGLSTNGALTSLNLSENELCGIDEDGDGEYDASGVTALADAIGKHQ